MGRSNTYKNLSKTPDYPVALSIRIRADVVTVLTPMLEEIGVLDTRTTCVLKSLMNSDPTVELEAYVDHEHTQQSIETTNSKRVLALSINIYGIMASSETMALLLSEAKLFLQEPTHHRPASTYYNPHFFSWDDCEATPRLRQLSLINSQKFAAEVDKTLTQPYDVRSSVCIEQDGRIRTVLHGLESCLSANKEKHADTNV